MGGQTYIWLVLVGGGLLAGAAFVGVLVAPSRAEAVMAFVGLSGFGAGALSLVEISGAYGRIDAIVYAFAFLVASAAGGWALASSLLSRLARRDAEEASPTETTIERSGAAVIVVACVEPPAYGPRETAGMLQELEDEGLIEPTLTTLPFMFFAQKARYRAIGGTSPAQAELKSLAERLEAPLSEHGVASVDWCACSGDHRVAPRVMAAVQAGFRRIVVAELAVGESLHLSSSLREVDSLRLETHGVDVRFTGPLAASDGISLALAKRVLTASDDAEITGVVLVGRGQPEARARRNPVYDENETALLNRVRMVLVEAGLPEHNVRIAWAEWNEPDVTSSVRHLAALGCRRVVVVPAAFPLDSIATRLDLEIAVRQARVEEGVIVVTLPAWKDDDFVVSEIVARVNAELGG